MSEEIDERGALSSRDRDASELFMLTFAALGPLAILAAEPASASLGTTPALTQDQADALLAGSNARPEENALGPPAAADSAFVAAFQALTGPASDAPDLAIGAGVDAASPGTAAEPAPDVLGDWYDDAIGSSTPPSAFGSSTPQLLQGAGAFLTVGGAGEVVQTTGGETISVLEGASVWLTGGGATVILAGHDHLSLSGVGYHVQAHGAGDVVTVQAASQAVVFGDGVAARTAAPGASLTIVGEGNVVQVAAGSSATVGGHDVAAQMSAGGVLNLMDHSEAAAYGAGVAYLGAGDFLALFGAFEVFAQGTAGASTISAFGASDVLHLRSDFADVASLLGAAMQDNGATVLRLDGAGDTLTLAGLDKAQVAALAAGGHIRLD
jgi:hypothetical protein